MVLGLFGKSKKKSPSGPPQDVAWVRSPKKRFYKFLNLEPEAMGIADMSAVYVLWHQGVRPQWVYVGWADNLEHAFVNLQRDDEILDYDRHGGLFVTWSMIKPEFQPGVAKYLNQVMKPVVLNPDQPEDDVEPIPVLLPGAPTQGDA